MINLKEIEAQSLSLYHDGKGYFEASRFYLSNEKLDFLELRNLSLTSQDITNINSTGLKTLSVWFIRDIERQKQIDLCQKLINVQRLEFNIIAGEYDFSRFGLNENSIDTLAILNCSKWSTSEDKERMIYAKLPMNVNTVILDKFVTPIGDYEKGVPHHIKFIDPTKLDTGLLQNSNLQKVDFSFTSTFDNKLQVPNIHRDSQLQINVYYTKNLDSKIYTDILNLQSQSAFVKVNFQFVPNNNFQSMN